MLNPNDTSHFDEIYDSTKKAVLTLITAKCSRTADINDIFQDTYLELFQLLEKRGVEYVTHEKALVLRIAKRKIAKYYSLTNRLKMFVSTTATDEHGDVADISELEADPFLTEDFAVNQVMLESAQKLIQQKSENVKKVFYLFYSVGLTIPEIATELSMSESGVKNHLYRTLKELKNLLNR
jgi:RNA polymerase sigma-70 factor (ECF subfamily)